MVEASTERQRLRRALAISLLLHGILLWQALATMSGMGSRAPDDMPSARLHAILRPTLAALPARPAEPRQASAPATPVKWLALPQPVTQVTAPAPSQATPASAEGLTRGDRVQPATTVEPQVIPAPTPLPADSAGLDANGLRQYRVSLAVAARRFRNFPPQALANGLSGIVEVRIAIAANGVPQPPQLERSSNHDALDAAALQMIASALQIAQLPDSLHGRSFSMRLPVEFGIAGTAGQDGK